MTSSIGEKIVRFFRNNVGYLAVVLASLAYIALGLVNIKDTGKTLGEILADGVLSFMLGISLSRFFNLQGFIRGEQDERYLKTIASHAQAVMDIDPYIDRLDDWCAIENAKALRLQRNKILINAGMKYEEFFDNDGCAKGFTEPCPPRRNKVAYADWRLKYKSYMRALRLKLTPLTGSTLTSEGVLNNDPNNLGPTKEQYRKQTFATEFITKVVSALFFGYYTFKLVEKVDVGMLIGAIFQVCLYLVFGVLSMTSAYLFVVDDYRNRVVRKIDNLKKFYNAIAESTPQKNAELSGAKETDNESDEKVL